MSYIPIFTMSFTIALLGALSPGPLLTAVVAKSPVYGFRAGPMLMIGHAVAEILMIVALVSGLSRFIRHPGMVSAIAIAGGVILIVFGLGMLRQPSRPLDKTDSSIRGCSRLPFLGITLSLSNPYWAVWWFTIGLGLVLSARKAGIAAVLVFFLGHILADVAWYSVVSFAVSRGRKFMSDRLYSGILKICGVLMAGFGIYCISSAFSGQGI